MRVEIAQIHTATVEQSDVFEVHEDLLAEWESLETPYEKEEWLRSSATEIGSSMEIEKLDQTISYEIYEGD